MSDFIKKYDIWIFLILAPLINAVFVYLVSKYHIPDFAYNHGRTYILFIFLICIVKFTKGNAGIKEVLKPMATWKVNPMWYLFSFVFSLIVGTVTLLLKSFYYQVELSSLYQIHIPLLKAIIYIIIWSFVGEVVWVSYSVRELSKKYNPFISSQIVGTFWTLWWVPVVYLNVGVITDLPIFALLLNMTGAAGMCTVVYAYTKSGVCVWILQSMLNLSLLILPVSPTLGGPNTYTLFAVIYFLTMLFLMYFLNPIKKLNVLNEA